jgi:hypothetical protein
MHLQFERCFVDHNPIAEAPGVVAQKVFSFKVALDQLCRLKPKDFAVFRADIAPKMTFLHMG